jgi:hypothetical protein
MEPCALSKHQPPGGSHMLVLLVPERIRLSYGTSAATLGTRDGAWLATALEHRGEPAAARHLQHALDSSEESVSLQLAGADAAAIRDTLDEYAAEISRELVRLLRALADARR